ncbi:MAG: RICIN domain-containing protein [Blastocatellia bacterium]
MSKIGTVCMDAERESTADGTRVIVWPCKASANQKVSYDPQTQALKIGGKCLDAKSGQGNDGDQIILWTCTKQPNQKWRFEKSGDGFLIVGINNKVIDVRGSNLFWNGILMQPRDLILFSRNGGVNQVWMTGSVRRQATADRPLESGLSLANTGGVRAGQVIAAGGGNVIAAGGGNVVSAGGAN